MLLTCLIWSEIAFAKIAWHILQPTQATYRKYCLLNQNLQKSFLHCCGLFQNSLFNSEIFKPVKRQLYMNKTKKTVKQSKICFYCKAEV